eukprot:scaffold1317_cov136-Skeletonema_marinoi.AAC.1
MKPRRRSQSSSIELQQATEARSDMTHQADEIPASSCRRGKQRDFWAQNALIEGIDNSTQNKSFDMLDDTSRLLVGRGRPLFDGVIPLVETFSTGGMTMAMVVAKGCSLLRWPLKISNLPLVKVRPAGLNTNS